MKLFDWFRMVFEKKEFGSKCFCECGHEILQDENSKIYEGGTFTNIICSQCGCQTTWDLDTPVPLLLYTLPKNK